SRHTRFSRDWSSDVCSSDLSGPAIFDNADNWYDETNSVFKAPSSWAATDDVVIANSSQPILFNLDQSAVTVNTLSVEASYRGAKIGRAACRGREYSGLDVVA